MGQAWGAAGLAPAAEALQPGTGVGGRGNTCCGKLPSGEGPSLSLRKYEDLWLSPCFGSLDLGEKPICHLFGFCTRN